MASGQNRKRHASRARVLWLVTAVALAALLTALAGCAERRSATDVELQAHPASWADPASPDFHGARVAAAGTATCTGCHGILETKDAGVPACNDCHVGASGHPGGYADRGSATFHGDEVAALGSAACKTCHGQDYAGGWAGDACGSCHPGGADNHPPAWSGHPDGFMTRESSLFHGLRAAVDGVEDCTRCHGFGLQGGTSGVACGDCHSH